MVIQENVFIMKIKNIILTVFVIAVISSCIEKGPGIDYDITLGNELTAPADNTVIDLASAASVTFSWSESEAEDGGYVSYEVLFDEEGGDFSTPVTAMPSRSNGGATDLSLSSVDLNEIALSAGMAAGENGVVKWTVRASKGIKGGIYGQANSLVLCTVQKL